MSLETEAKAILETGDWVKHQTLQIHPDGTCGMCLVGALRFAFNNTWQWQASPLTKTEHVRMDAPNYEGYTEAVDRVAHRVRDRNPELVERMSKEALDKETVLMRFNDDDDTSFDDVLAVLEP